MGDRPGEADEREGSLHRPVTGAASAQEHHPIWRALAAIRATAPDNTALGPPSGRHRAVFKPRLFHRAARKINGLRLGGTAMARRTFPHRDGLVSGPVPLYHSTPANLPDSRDFGVVRQEGRPFIWRRTCDKPVPSPSSLDLGSRTAHPSTPIGWPRTRPSQVDPNPIGRSRTTAGPDTVRPAVIPEAHPPLRLTGDHRCPS